MPPDSLNEIHANDHQRRLRNDAAARSMIARENPADIAASSRRPTDTHPATTPDLEPAATARGERYRETLIRFRQGLSSRRVTPVGAILLVVLVLAIAAVFVGPPSAQGPAFALITIITLILLAPGISTRLGSAGTTHGLNGRITKTLTDRRSEFRPRPRRSSTDDVETSTSDDVRRRARERYNEKNDTH
jgi:hypothetical protein